MMQLSPQDATFLHLENAAIKTHFTVVTVYDQSTAAGGLVRYRAILDYFDRIMRELPVFRRKLQRVPLDLDTPYLVDDPNFHIESHIRHIALPAPHDWRQFCILCAQVEAVPMDLTKPLWDMTVVEGLSNLDGLPEGSFALLTRLHHSVADGSTVRSLLAALHMPEGKSFRSGAEGAGEAAPVSLPRMALRGTRTATRQVLKLESAALRHLPMVGRQLGRVALSRLSGTGKDRLEHDDTHVPETLFNQELSYRRVYQVVRVPLDEVQAIKRAVAGTTVNDVVMAGIGGGMHAYLKHEGADPGADLYAVCTVNLRDDKFANDSLIGNNISLMRACLHNTRATPLEQLRKLSEEMRASKKVQSASSTRELMALGQNIPNVFVAAASRLVLPYAMQRMRGRPLANAIITNVPGPQQPLYFLGARMVLLTGVAPLAPGTGATYGVLSYDGTLTISITACPEWVPDPQELARCIRERFAELHRAAQAASES